MLRRLLIAGAGGSFVVVEVEPTNLYALFNGQSGDGVYAIGAATRTSGVWSEHGANPILEKGSSTTWDDGHVKDPCLLHDGSQYVCYYAGYDGATYRIGRATASAYTGSWTKDIANPVVDLGAGGTFNDAGCNFPTVLYEPTDTGKEWKMWFGANDGSVESIGYAYSSDGITWTTVGQVLTKGTGGTWDDVGILPGAIYKSGATYYLFYGGRQSATPSYFWQGGYATFTDPEGAYTKYASNPTLLARFNDANTSQTPTADVTAGATTVALTTPGAFNVGEPVVVADGDTTAENFYLSAIGGASVTLDRAVTGNFTGGGKVFRSFAFQSLFPRSVRKIVDGDYELFGTPFQPVEDLTQPASKLWEGSFEWTQSALTGNWTYRYTAGRGMLFPLSVGAAWHSRSAENPSVVAGTSGSPVVIPPVIAPGALYIAPSGNDTTGDGSVANPWQTIGKFLARPPVPGDLLYCRGGTYPTVSGNYTHYVTGVAGTSTDRITIAAYPGETPVFDGGCGTSLSNRHFIALRDGSSYWTIDGLRIVNYLQGLFGIVNIGQTSYTTPTEHTILRNLYIEMAESPLAGNGDHAIYLQNYVDDTLIEDCELVGPVDATGTTGAGVHVFHSPDATNTAMRRLFIRKWEQGFEMDGADANGTIEWCTFMDNTVADMHFYDHAAWLIRNNVSDGSASTFYDEDGSGPETSTNNYPTETLNVDGTLQAGSAAIGGASDGSDAGAYPF